VTLHIAVVLSAVFASVSAVVGGILWVALHRLAPQRRRLREITGDSVGAAPAAVMRLRSSPHPLVARVAAMMPRTTTRTAQVRERLVAAGYRSAPAASIFASAQLAVPVASVVVVLVAGGVAASGFACLAAAIGYALPDIVLRHLVAQRRQVIAKALPDLLDLLVLCLESGCSLEQAILKTSDELSLACPPLAEELALISHEVRAGKARSEAFRQFAERTGVEEARTLVSLLVQTDRYGTSVIQALRVNAELFRTGRRQDAEERAARANVKLVFPLVFCLFPAFYIIALGPAIMQFVRVFLEVVASVD